VARTILPAITDQKLEGWTLQKNSRHSKMEKARCYQRAFFLRESNRIFV
jgi:hypothetical protein